MRMAGLIVAIVCLVFGSNASARDDLLMFPIEDAMTTPDASGRLNQGIKFYFGDQKHPKVLHSFGELESNKKTNAFNKSDKAGCEWAFLSAMLAFQQRALEMGGNAVINIKSYYRKHLVESATDYECGSGVFVTGVTFLGTVAKLAE